MQGRLTGFMPNGANRVVVCIDTADDWELQGRWYSLFRSGAQPFSTVLQLLMGMEELYGELSFPQNTLLLRSLRPERKKNGPGTGMAEKTEVRQRMEEKMLETQAGGKATFVVQIQFRQNATWQGTLTWAEKNKSSHFRSALELLKMMDEAVQSAAETAKSEESAG